MSEVESIEKVKQFIKEHKPDLSISRVPKKTLEIFKDIAKEEFADDYGMCLKWLVDNAIENERYNELSRRISVLEEKLLYSDTKPIVTLSGKKLEVKRRD